MKTKLFFIIVVMLFASSCTQNNTADTFANQADLLNLEMLRANAVMPPEDIGFSVPSGFYGEIVLELKNNTGDYMLDIRYTTDGAEPAASSSIYNTAIRRFAGSAPDFTSLTVRAALFEGDKRVSKIFTNSYLISSGAQNRFDVPVIFVSTGHENLWNHDYGIFADGRLRQEWQENNPRRRPEFTSPANWWAKGKEWERPAYVETFEPDGTRVAAQDAGVRIHGGWSRGNNNQRSLRIFARSEYDPDNTYFDYEIFTNNTSEDGTNKLITSYKRLVLRNGGNDHWSTRIRDEVSQDIAAEFGIDTQNSRAGVLFLNGEFYGIIQVKQTYDRFALKDRYNAPNDDFTILEMGTSSGGYRVMNGEPDEEQKYAALVREINRGLATTDAGKKILEEQMDVHEVLKYYAFQIYIGNGDWPHNNYKIYKYNAPELAPGNGKLDGRWRYLLFDTDFGMGLSGSFRETNILSSCLNSRGDGGLFAGLMQNDDYRNTFIKLVCDLINIYYTRDNTFYYIGARSLEIANEIPLQMGRTGWNQNTAVMYDWVEGRPDVMYRQLERNLRAGSLYNINLTQNIEGGNTHINEFKLTDKSWTGRHYMYTRAEISAVPLPGWKLEKWVINGEEIYDAVIIPERYIFASTVNIQAVFVTDNSLEGCLVVNEVYYDSNGSGYIELYNPTNSEVPAGLYSLFIHNYDENTRTELDLADTAVAPFSYVLINRSGIKGGRDEIILTRELAVIGSLRVPELKPGESYGRYPDGGDNLVYMQKCTPNEANELGSDRIKIFEYMKNRVMPTGRLQPKNIVPIRQGREIFVPLSAVEEYNGDNAAAIHRIARNEAERINGGMYVPLSAFEGTRVRINDIILEKLNSVIFYR